MPLPLPVDIARHPDKQGTSEIPKPLVAYSADEINEQFGEGSNAYFRIVSEGFWNGKNILEMKRGTRFLWKNVLRTSTKVEYFSGLVEDWHDREFLDIS